MAGAHNLGHYTVTFYDAKGKKLPEVSAQQISCNSDGSVHGVGWKHDRGAWTRMEVRIDMKGLPDVQG
jgi:hypothetical protein